MKNQQNKELNCIAIKREAQNRNYQETREMTPQQQIEYFHNAYKKVVSGNGGNKPILSQVIV